jgi:HEAT repeat protein
LKLIDEASEEPRRFAPEIAPTSASDASSASANGLDTITLVQQLGAPSIAQREAAELALRQRGFGEAHLAVARQFIDSRADVRLRLVERLAQQSIVPPLPWLLQLLDDRDARVRLATANVLATSSDPSVIRRLRERALSENDLEVRAALQRTAK